MMIEPERLVHLRLARRPEQIRRLRIQALGDVCCRETRYALADQAILRKRMTTFVNRLRLIEAGRDDDPARSCIDGMIGRLVDSPVQDRIARRRADTS